MADVGGVVAPMSSQRPESEPALFIERRGGQGKRPWSQEAGDEGEAVSLSESRRKETCESASMQKKRRCKVGRWPWKCGWRETGGQKSATHSHHGPSWVVQSEWRPRFGAVPPSAATCVALLQPSKGFQGPLAAVASTTATSLACNASRVRTTSHQPSFFLVHVMSSSCQDCLCIFVVPSRNNPEHQTKAEC